MNDLSDVIGAALQLVPGCVLDDVGGEERDLVGNDVFDGLDLKLAVVVPRLLVLQCAHLNNPSSLSLSN